MVMTIETSLPLWQKIFNQYFQQQNLK